MNGDGKCSTIASNAPLSVKPFGTRYQNMPDKNGKQEESAMCISQAQSLESLNDIGKVAEDCEVSQT